MKDSLLRRFVALGVFCVALPLSAAVGRMDDYDLGSDGSCSDDGFGFTDPGPWSAIRFTFGNATLVGLPGDAAFDIYYPDQDPGSRYVQTQPCTPASGVSGTV